MNLREFNNGTVAQKNWLRPVCGKLTCGSVDAQQQFLEQGVYTSLTDLQGFGLGEHPLLPPGEGSLTIPLDTLRKGSVLKLTCKGLITCPAGAVLTFRLKGTTLSAGTQDLVIITFAKLNDSTIKDWFIDFTIACREDGGVGVAEFQMFGEGRVFTDTVPLTPESFANDANLNTFGTDEPLTLQLTAESDAVTLNILSRIAEIRI